MNEEVKKICEAVKAALEACNIPARVREPSDDESDDKASCLVIETAVMEPLLVGVEHRKWATKRAEKVALEIHSQAEIAAQPARTYYTVGIIDKYDTVGRREEPDTWEYREYHATKAPAALASYILSTVLVEHTNRILDRYFPGIFREP